MKEQRSVFKIANLLMLLMVSACASNQQNAADAVNSSVPVAPAGSANTAAQPAVQSPTVNAAVLPGTLRDLQENVGDRVFFDYDRSELNPAGRDTLRKQAAWLLRYPTVTLVIEGHCDERGTREYNLALGARRASAVKNYLITVGIQANRLDTVSYGKERPLCAASNEQCWRENRLGISTIVGAPTPGV